MLRGAVSGQTAAGRTYRITTLRAATIGSAIRPDESADVRADRPCHATDLDWDRLQARVGPADHDLAAGQQPERAELPEPVASSIGGQPTAP